MFDPVSSPIRTLADVRSVNDVAIQSTGVFDPGYFESYGGRVIGSPVVSNSDSGYVILESAAGYQIMYYQRTHFTTGVGLHNYMEPRTFAHPQSARRYARTF